MPAYFSDENLYKAITKKTIQSLEDFYTDPEKYASLSPPRHVTRGIEIPGVDTYLDSILRTREGKATDFIYADELPALDNRYLVPGANPVPVYCGLVDGKQAFRHIYWSDSLTDYAKEGIANWRGVHERFSGKDDTVLTGPTPKSSPLDNEVAQDFYRQIGEMMGTIEALKKEIADHKTSLDDLKKDRKDIASIEKAPNLLDASRKIGAGMTLFFMKSAEIAKSTFVALWAAREVAIVSSVVVSGVSMALGGTHVAELTSHALNSFLPGLVAPGVEHAVSGHDLIPHSPAPLLHGNHPSAMEHGHRISELEEKDPLPEAVGTLPGGERSASEFDQTRTSLPEENFVASRSPVGMAHLSRLAHVDDFSNDLPSSPVTETSSGVIEDHYTQMDSLWREGLAHIPHVDPSFIANMPDLVRDNDYSIQMLQDTVRSLSSHHPDWTFTWPSPGEHKGVFIGTTYDANLLPIHILREGPSVYMIPDTDLAVGVASPGNTVVFDAKSVYEMTVRDILHDKPSARVVMR